MTDEERYIIQGRIRDQLKQARVSAATLKADIDAHARKLREAAQSLAQFLDDPVGRGPTGMLKHEYLAHFYGQFMNNEIGRKLAEFAATSDEIAKLEKQIAEFD